MAYLVLESTQTGSVTEVAKRNGKSSRPKEGRDKKGLFQKGNKYSSGRPKGALGRYRVFREMCEAKGSSVPEQLGEMFEIVSERIKEGTCDAATTNAVKLLTEIATGKIGDTGKGPVEINVEASKDPHQQNDAKGPPVPSTKELGTVLIDLAELGKELQTVEIPNRDLEEELEDEGPPSLSRELLG